MPFFVPSDLIEFDYLGGVSDPKYEQEAKDYRNAIDFAFFAVNFGYSKADYNALTPLEKAFILKAWESKLVSDTTYQRNAVLNAISNAFRKKGKKFIPLWKKKQKRINKEVAKDNLKLVENLEKQNGKAWVDLVYKANGIKKKKRGDDPRLITR